MTTKEIIRVNLFPNARCVASGSQPSQKVDLASIKWNSTDHNFSLVNEGEAGAFAYWLIPVTAGSAYVFRCGIIYTFDNPKLMTKDDWDRYQVMEDRPQYVYWDLMPLPR